MLVKFLLRRLFPIANQPINCNFFERHVRRKLIFIFVFILKTEYICTYTKYRNYTLLYICYVIRCDDSQNIGSMFNFSLWYRNGHVIPSYFLSLPLLSSSRLSPSPPPPSPAAPSAAVAHYAAAAHSVAAALFSSTLPAPRRIDTPSLHPEMPMYVCRKKIIKRVCWETRDVTRKK